MIIAYHISTKPAVMTKVASVVRQAVSKLKCSFVIYSDGWGRTRLDFAGFTAANHEQAIATIDGYFLA